MKYTLVPQILGHVRYQHYKSFVLLALMIGIFVSAPFTVRWLHEELTQTTSGLITKLLIELWPYCYILSTVLAAIHREVCLGRPCQKCALTVSDEATNKIVTHWCREVRLPAPQVVLNTIEYNAGVQWSLRFGYILFIGKPLRAKLETPLFRALLAHETAHIKHGDIAIMWITVHMQIALYFSNGMVWLLAPFLLWDAATHWSSDPFVFLIAVYSHVYAAYVLFILLQYAHCRTREYVADAAAIHQLGWEQRKDYISLLLLIESHGWRDLVSVFRYPESRTLLLSHPTTPDRVRALGMDVRFRRNNEYEIVETM